MDLEGSGANAELVGDHPVRMTDDEVLEHLLFPAERIAPLRRDMQTSRVAEKKAGLDALGSNSRAR